MELKDQEQQRKLGRGGAERNNISTHQVNQIFSNLNFSVKDAQME